MTSMALEVSVHRIGGPDVVWQPYQMEVPRHYQKRVVVFGAGRGSQWWDDLRAEGITYGQITVGFRDLAPVRDIGPMDGWWSGHVALEHNGVMVPGCGWQPFILYAPRDRPTSHITYHTFEPTGVGAYQVAMRCTHALTPPELVDYSA